MTLPAAFSEPLPARRAAIYARISADPEGLRAGVTRQEADCRTFCAARGWEVVGVFVDNDVSAYSGKTRPRYRELLAEVEAGRVDAVVAWHPDRLHRSPKELEEFITLVETTRCAVGTVTAGDLDLSTASGRMTARVVGAVARGESEHRSERIRRKARSLAEEGKLSGGGTRPFGFEPDRRTVRESEAALIRQAARDVLGGVTATAVCRAWNTAGITTSFGGSWSAQALDRVLRSARIAGLRSHHGTVTARAEWPAIIDVATRDALLATLGEKRRFPGQGARKYLLSGFAYCGVCGARLVARPRADKRRCYVCATGPGFSGCGKIRRLAEAPRLPSGDPGAIDTLVSDAVIHRLSSPGFAAALTTRTADDPEAAALTEAIAAADKKLNNAKRHLIEGDLTQADYRRFRADIEAEAATLRRQLAQRAGRRVLVDLPPNDRLAGWWQSADLGQRRALIELLIEKIVVHPAVRGRQRFDPSKIEIQWKA